MKHHLLIAGVSVLASALMLTAPVSAQATAEDVFRALSEAGMFDSFVQDARNHFQTLPHDENGMEMGGEYHTYDEWVEIIHREGADYVWELVADEFCVDAEKLKAYYAQKESGEAEEYHPSVEPEKPFAEMTLEEKRAYVDSLPEEERAQFLANLTVEERNSILKELDSDKKQEVIENIIDLGQQMGMNVTVDDTENYRFSIRDQDGNLIDSTGFGLTVDPTGWDTTAPVLLGSGMILTACGGIFLLMRRGRKQED